MTKAEFVALPIAEKNKHLSTMNKKQLQKLCRAYGLRPHGGTFVMKYALVHLK